MGARARNLSLRAGLAAALVASVAAPSAAVTALIPERPFPSARAFYEPLFADPTEPSYGGRLIYPPGGPRLGEITIGDYVGLTRWRLADRWNAQLNLGGGGIGRFNLTTKRNSLEVIDFSLVVPLDIAFDRDKVLRVAWVHTSSHLGDDYIARVKPPILYKRALDAIRATLSLSPAKWARAYAGGGFAWNQVNLGGRGSFQLGLELMSREFWRRYTRAFLAQDFQTSERVAWNPSYNIRGGLRWSDPGGAAAASLFMEYFTGRPYYLQFQELRESHWGFGLRFEIGNRPGGWEQGRGAVLAPPSRE